jgi:hypothetical protein
MARKETTMEELSAVASAMDSGKSLEEARAMVDAPTAEPETEPQADPPPEPEQPKDDGELTPSSGGESSLTEKTEPKTPDISREAKEMERKVRSWSSLNTEKEKHQERVEEFEQREEKFRLQQLEDTSEIRDEDGYNAKDYDKAEADFREDGEKDLADEAERKAESLREQKRTDAQKLQQQQLHQQTEQQKEQFSKAFNENYKSAREDYPDLGKHDSELFKRTEQVFLYYPSLLNDPDGPRKAAWVASRDILATQTESFRDENQRLTKELDEYKSKLSIGGSEPAPRPANKEFMDMDSDARFKVLTDNAAQMDRQSAG